MKSQCLFTGNAFLTGGGNAFIEIISNNLFYDALPQQRELEFLQNVSW